jgi:rhodanese-related sulfurtransferase
MKQHLGRALILVTIAIGLSLVGNAISPRGIPLKTPAARTVREADFVSFQQAREWWEDGTALFLDAREPNDFMVGHIANSFNLPAQSFERHFGEIAPMLTPESRIVVYCDGIECELSHRVKESLEAMGYKNAQVLFNGWTVWREAGLPTEQGSVN